MKKIRLKILAALMAFALAALLTGCSENTQQGGAEQPESDIPAQDDIVILFTNEADIQAARSFIHSIIQNS